MAVPKAAGNGASLLRSCHMLLARAEGHRGGGALLNSLARNQSWRKETALIVCASRRYSTTATVAASGGCSNRGPSRSTRKPSIIIEGGVVCRAYSSTSSNSGGAVSRRHISSSSTSSSSSASSTNTSNAPEGRQYLGNVALHCSPLGAKRGFDVRRADLLERGVGLQGK